MNNSMRKILGLILIFYVFIIGVSYIQNAYADLPAGVKEQYEYNKTDKSIIKVKERLQELGYFPEDAQFSDFVSQDLKKAVISFQKQNNVKADGVLDKDLLELLFSKKAIKKGGKTKANDVTVTKAPSVPKETKADSTSKKTQKGNETSKKNGKETSKKNEAKEDFSDVYRLLAYLGIGFVALIITVVLINKSNENSLVKIINRYKELKQDHRCKKAIIGAGIAINLLASSGEYFLIPLVQGGNGYRLRYGRNTVMKAEKKCGTKIISMLDRIARNGLVDQEKINQELCDIWGTRKSGKTIVGVGMEDYKNTMFLFSSLVSSGIIRGNDQLNRDAFLFLVWECALNMIIKSKKTVEDVLKEIRSTTANNSSGVKINGVSTIYQSNVYALYETLDQKADTITYYMTAKQYIEDGMTMWYSIYAKNAKDVAAVIAEIEKRRYVDNLLHDTGKPRVKILTTDTMNSAAFEKLVEVLFNKMGYNAKTTQLTGDQGVDVVAEKKGRRVVIQAKCYSSPVGNTAVQEVVAGKRLYQASEAYVVTNSTYTRSAIELARANDVVLWDRNNLAQMLERYCVYTSEINK